MGQATRKTGKPILVSGIQPSGRMHIGNYLGALKNFVDLERTGKYRCYWIVVDLHSFTSVADPFDAKQKEREIVECAANFVAAGMDPDRSTFFLQSLVPAHAELAWTFSTITPLGELYRMTQFKDKVGSSSSDAEQFEHRAEGVNAGLLVYPTLMAADILLYDAKFVPVGDDQKQHLELTRAIARKFNARFGNTFIEPQAIFTPTPRIMSLGDPSKKMSKSVPESCLFLDDEPEAIKAKVMRAVTDSETEVRYDRERKPGIANLLDIMSGLSGEPIPKIEKRFAGKNYGELKREVASTIADRLADFRKKKKVLLKKPATIKNVLRRGSAQAAKVANKKMAVVRKKIGIAL